MHIFRSAKTGQFIKVPSIIKIAKPVVFGGLGCFTLHPGTICKVIGNGTNTIFVLPKNKSILTRLSKKYVGYIDIGFALYQNEYKCVA